MSRSSDTPAQAGADVLFTADLSRALAITPDGVRKALREGRLGAYGRLGRRLFVRRSTFLAYLATLEFDPARPKSRNGTTPDGPTSGGAR